MVNVLSARTCENDLDIRQSGRQVCVPCELLEQIREYKRSEGPTFQYPMSGHLPLGGDGIVVKCDDPSMGGSASRSLTGVVKCYSQMPNGNWSDSVSFIDKYSPDPLRYLLTGLSYQDITVRAIIYIHIAEAGKISIEAVISGYVTRELT